MRDKIAELILLMDNRAHTAKQCADAILALEVEGKIFYECNHDGCVRPPGMDCDGCEHDIQRTATIAEWIEVKS